MAKSQQSWNKREREKKKQKDKQDKADRMQERKASGGSSKSLEDMMAYIDEDGNISSTPPDPRKKVTINAEDIEIGVPKQRELSPEDLLRHGIVTFFNHEKGYGIIKDQQTQESIFVHINSSADELKENNRVVFEVEKGPRGLNAVNVRIEK